MPIYAVTTKGDEKKRLVKAASASAAISHCAKAVFSAEVMTKVEDAAPLFAAGVVLETAGEAPAGEAPSGGDAS